MGPTSFKHNVRNVITFGPSFPDNSIGPDGITGPIPIFDDSGNVVGGDEFGDDDDDY